MISFSQKKFQRSLKPTDQQLKSLGLKEGPNTITFKVQLGARESPQVSAALYFWRGDPKFVISDIDGTITKSDALGHIMPILGKDWSHSGVACLYNNVIKNGYKIIYLSSRAIGQAGTTRTYLTNLRQNGVTLPPGPVLMSPFRLLTAFKKEVIDRRPEVFKIACLKDIKSISPPNSSPFYAGFGNRVTDLISYESVGIPRARIFIINPAGEIRTTNKTFTQSYASLNDIVEMVFPPNHRVDPSYDAFSFWKLPLPPLD